ncbi:MAG: cell division protein FtsA [Bacteroidetes bacterium]|nr:cell division protein FtsA [Bacteroidota bacterium]
MQNDAVIVGLDIGTTKVCAIVGKRNEFGKIEVLGMGKAESLGVIRGEVRNIDKTVKSINEAIERAKQSMQKTNNIGLEIVKVHVGIAGQHIKSLQHRNSISRINNDDEISYDDVDRLIKDTINLALPPGDKIIHVLPQEYSVDDFADVVDPVGMAGIRLSCNFHIITGNVDAIKNIFKCVDRAGLDVAGLILEPLSSADAVLTPEEMEAGVCLVDIGGGTTDVAIFKNGIIRHTAVIPFGGNIITEDIVEGCSVLRNQAELLKVKFGSALEEIFEAVLYEIKSSGLERKLNAGIVITGGGSQLNHLDKLVEFVTGFDSRIGYANEHLAKTKIEEIKSPMYATGVGLVLKGFRALEDEENKGKIKTKIPELAETKSQESGIKLGGFLIDIVKKGKDWLYEKGDIEDFSS